MPDFLLIIITLAISAVGGWFATKLRVPAGYMVGGMVLVGIFSIFTSFPFLPVHAKYIIQTISGTYIGASISREDFLRIRTLIKPTVIMMTSMVVLCIGMGLLMHRLTGLDLVTSLFACVPGGVSDMTIISMDMGADSAQVAVLQLVRLIGVIGFFPLILGPIAQWVDRKEAVRAQNATSDDQAASAPMERSVEDHNAGSEAPKEQPLAAEVPVGRRQTVLRTALTFAVASVGGFLGYILKIPAGALACSMIFAAVYNVASNRAHMPVFFRSVAQIASGALIGVTITMEKVLGMRYVILPAVLLVVLYILVNLVIAYLIHRNSELDYITSVFASAPAGAMEMSLISADLGADGAKVAILQIFRLICVIMIFPSVIQLVCSILS